MAHQRLRFPAPTSLERRSLPHALRDPLRAATIGAVVLTVIGAGFAFLGAWFGAIAASSAARGLGRQ